MLHNCLEPTGSVLSIILRWRRKPLTCCDAPISTALATDCAPIGPMPAAR